MQKILPNASTRPATETLIIDAAAAGPHDLITLRPSYDPANFDTEKRLPRQLIITEAPGAVPPPGFRIELVDVNGNSETIPLLAAWLPMKLDVQPAQLGAATDVDVMVLW